MRNFQPRFICVCEEGMILNPLDRFQCVNKQEETTTTEATTSTEATTTEKVTTKAPTTLAPTTQVPTTQASTTQAATTQAATTQAPTTTRLTTPGVTVPASSVKMTESYQPFSPTAEAGDVSEGATTDVSKKRNKCKNLLIFFWLKKKF